MENSNKEDVKKLYGFYRAKVIDNKDPKKFGRVKVWIPDFFVDIPTNQGLWARPANNPLGGRNDEMKDEKLQYYGSLYVPEKDSWVWIFFEAGNINRPYYWCALDIENKQVPPENQQGQNYELKWTIIRSKQGRVIVISDDPSDERVEITGKKSNITDVYSIDDNMKTILIDERQGKEKILIKDQNGNYINIDTTNNDIHINSKHNINIHVDNNCSISSGGDIKIKSGGKTSFNISENMDIQCGGTFKLQASEVHLQEGASPSDPEQPKGDRE